MTAITGNLALSVALLVAAGGVLAAMTAARQRSDAALRAARWMVAATGLLFTVAAAALVTALLRSDFRFEYVANYTERAMPVGYKFAAFWAGQEGSLLLWAWMLSVLCTIAVAGHRRHSGPEHAVAAGVLALVCGFFAALLLFAVNPFDLITTGIPADGRGLNPQLQDPAMVIHPPLLFLGYAGFTIPFAVMVGVLVAGRTDNRWIALVRRWLLVSWMFLGAGIVLGAWWAYVELGWGGYWAWDPVENASILPWLTATALMHSIMVQQHRGMFKRWTAGLMAVTFILCIFGTYLTRSGVIDSVHAFAGSLLGSFFLVFLAVLVAGSIALFAWRYRMLAPDRRMDGVVSREGAFLLGNVLLMVMAATVLVGTIFPLLSAPFAGHALTVKPQFYNRVVGPMALLLVGLMTVGPVLVFGRDAAGRIGRSLMAPAIVTLVITAVVGVTVTANPWALVCVALTALGTLSVIVDFARSVAARRRNTGEGLLGAGVRLVDRDHRRYGGQLAHLGIMMIVIGVAGSSLFAVDQTHQLHPGERAVTGRYTITFDGLDEVRGTNFTAVQATVRLDDGHDLAMTLYPERRFYDTWPDEPNSEVAIHSAWREDVYVSLAGWQDGGAITAIEVRVNPGVLWIWVGGIVLTAGVLFCALPPLLTRTSRVPAARPVTAVTAMIAALLLPAASVDAQAVSPDPAPSTGSLAVQAIQGTPGGPAIGARDVTVLLYHQGMVLQTIQTRLDEHGVVMIEGLPLGVPMQPLVQVTCDGLIFEKVGENMDPTHPDQAIKVQCFEPTDVEPDWSVSMWHVMADRIPNGLAVTEIVVVDNPADHAWVVPAEADPARPVPALFPLPESATQVMLQRGPQVADNLPLIPGPTEFKFSYQVTGAGAIDLPLTAPARVDHVMLLVSDQLQVVSAGGLIPAGTDQAGGHTISAFNAAGVEAGTTIPVVLAAAMPMTAGGAPAPDTAGGDFVKLLRLLAAIGGGALLVAALVVVLRPRRSASMAEGRS